jgi:hypothetical protein
MKTSPALSLLITIICGGMEVTSQLPWLLDTNIEKLCPKESLIGKGVKGARTSKLVNTTDSFNSFTRMYGILCT